jgi:creatinine amidohydrolase
MSLAQIPFRAAALLVAAAGLVAAQSPPTVKWEELTASDFVAAVEKAQHVCLLPFGIVEKHGPHLPLGTDLLNVRYITLRAAEREYAPVFPEYYFGQIFEARQQPGTIAYSARIQMDLLQETVSEMARNGCQKILIVNGHGGNNHLLPFFAQSQLASPRDYVVYVRDLPNSNQPGRPALKTPFDFHAGEGETSATLIARPDLVHMDKVPSESGADLNRLKLPSGIYTAIWWYGRFPEHYAGDASPANKELGAFDTKADIDDLVQCIRAVKADQTSPRLQKEFFEKAKQPLETKQ